MDSHDGRSDTDGDGRATTMDAQERRAPSRAAGRYSSEQRMRSRHGGSGHAERDSPDHQKSRKQLLAELAAVRARLADYEAATDWTGANEGSADESHEGGESGTGAIVRLPVSRREAGVAEAHGERDDERRKAYALARWREDFTRAITVSLGEGVYAVDHNGHVMFMNPAASELLGYSLGELIGRPAHEKIHYLHPDGTPFAPEDSPIARVMSTQETYRSGDEVFVRKDGTLLPVAYIATPFASDGKLTGAVVAFHDISERQRTDRRRALDLAISRVLAEVSSLEEGAPRLLEALAGSIGWETAGLWLPNARTRRLECAALWSAPGVQVTEFHMLEKERTFGPGEKSPGIVWTTGTAQWIGDLTLEARGDRRDAAIAAGVRAVVGFPVRDSGGGVLGVVLCGGTRAKPVDEDLLAVLVAAGERIGIFMERAEAERARRASEARMRATLEIALDSIVVMDASNRIVEFNAAAERT
ncbi:MAG: PAS domain S-box protein, partial [Ktedonobacterales bacterium]